MRTFKLLEYLEDFKLLEYLEDYSCWLCRDLQTNKLEYILLSLPGTPLIDLVNREVSVEEFSAPILVPFEVKLLPI